MRKSHHSPMKQRYDSYKPSGIDWIGDIPSHWTVSKLKHHIHIDSGDYISKDEISDDNKIPVFGGGEQIGFASKSNVSENTLIIGRVGARGGCVTPIIQRAWATDNSLICIPKKDFKFLYYLLLAANLNKLNESNAQPLITSTKVKNLIIGMPPLAEQEAIAAWLDEKCGEIDAAIAKVDREIELIDELKQSEISRVVTRGLNPHVPLRPSGIDWIGDIPKHWAMARIRNIIEQTKNGIKIGPFGSALTGHVLTGLPYKVYGQWNIVGKDFKAGIGTVSASIFKNLQAYEVKENDILISMMGTIGKCSIVPSHICPGIMDSHVVKIRLNTNLYNSRYFEYIYDKDNSNIIISELSLKKKGSIMDGLNSSIIKDLHILVPPLSEQQAIADYLDKKCAEIDGLRAKLIKKRETLTELRQSIISEVVTGKRKII